jgi:hypothetical protein
MSSTTIPSDVLSPAQLVKDLAAKVAEYEAFQSAKADETPESSLLYVGAHWGYRDAARQAVTLINPNLMPLFETCYAIKKRELDTKEYPFLPSNQKDTLPIPGSPCTGTTNADHYGGTVYLTITGKRPEIHVKMDNGARNVVRFNKNLRWAGSSPRWNDGCLVYSFGKAVNRLDPHF